ncbi:hypothetical protein HK102_003823 [Quaeritorhiza haematococci]|nr:hypothetical protein HK102_003823 [Quaeritorhiza haematococci]
MATKPHKPLTLLSLNTYLIPPFLTKHKTLPILRASRLSAFLQSPPTPTTTQTPKPHIAFLQEAWGPGFDILNARTKGYTAPPEIRSAVTEVLPFIPRAVKTVWDWWRLWSWHGTGGLHCLWKEETEQAKKAEGVKLLYSSREQYNVSATRSRKGVYLTLWDVSALWGPFRYLAVFNTHLDAFNNDNKRVQISQLAQLVKRSLTKDVTKVVEERARIGWGGKEESWEKGPVGAWSRDAEPPLARVGVVMVGDFNMVAGGDMYKDVLMGMFDDGAKEFAHTQTSVTNAEEECKKTDQTTLVDYCHALHGDKAHDMATYDRNNSIVEVPGNFGRIDYVLGVHGFSIKDPITGDKKWIRTMPLKCVSFEVLKQPRGEEMSDHWPVIAQLVPSNADVD